MSLVHLEPLPRHTSKSDLLALLAEAGGVGPGRIGKIELHGNRATIEVPDGWESRLAKALDGQRFGQGRVRAWCTAEPSLPATGEDHFLRLARLLEREMHAQAQQAAEVARRLSASEAERNGNSLVDLVVVDEDTGLGGRYLLELVKRHRGQLPWTRLDVGTPVLLSAEKARRPEGQRGVVCRRQANSIQVALTSAPEELEAGSVWRLDLSGDEVAGARQKAALERARLASGDRLAELRQVLLLDRQPRFDPQPDPPPLDSSLNESQVAAVRLALAAQDVALIHGPPGTGKTTAVVELIRQAVRKGQKVLACAPSNLAVDNVFERLLAAGSRAVRLGHPARVLPELRAHTLDLLVEEHPDVRVARKMVKEAIALFRRADRYTRAQPAPGARREIRQEARSLLAEARRLEALAADHILDTADVLCATTTALDSELLGPRRFDLAVIDEASQSTEPGCWIPLVRCDRVVLAGDHCQLPPTVVSSEATKEGFGVSLFERLMAVCGPSIARRLEIQYRMHEAIMDFSSREFYDGRLEAAPAVRQHLLADLPGVVEGPLTSTAVEFIDTAGADYDEELEADGESRRNPREASLVVRKVRALVEHGLPASDIAVITPYAAQVRLLRDLLDAPGLEIDSVDGFQGREKEAVVISLVRSNTNREIGFLADVRRMNVALTRARRKLLVVGDSATLASHPFYGRLLEYFEARGAYRTVWEEPDSS